MKQLLRGLKVLELGQFIRVPYCCKILSDFGAEIIKVETPGLGDVSRRYGPFPEDSPHQERSGLFMYLNGNKIGVTLDVSDDRGKEAFLKLISKSDLVVDEYRPKERDEIGLNYDVLKAINPRLIVTSITAFGQKGPYSNYKGHSLQLAAGSVASRIGDPDRPPLSTQLYQPDYYAGLHGCAASLVALEARNFTGSGQFVDISAMECLSNGYGSITMGNIFHKLTSDSPRGGYRSNSLYPIETLPCKDGYFNITTTIVPHWKRYLQVMGNPEWAKDSRVQNLERGYVEEHRDELDANQMDWLSNYTKEELWKIFRENRLPFYPVQKIPDVLESDQLKDRDYFQVVDQPEVGHIKIPGMPLKLSDSDFDNAGPSPCLGQDNYEILCERLGYSRDDVDSLKEGGVV